MSSTFEVKIPFSGFYCSSLSAWMESEMESFTEYSEDNDKSPDELQVDLSDCLSKAMDWEAYCLAMAKEYVKAFEWALSGEIDLPDYLKEGKAVGDLGISFEALTSPKYYNFETDRLFVNIPKAIVYWMHVELQKDSFVTMRKLVKERHSSRSGFMSAYPSDFSDWPDELIDYDHNHFETLLLAFLELKGIDVQQRQESSEYDCAEEVSKHFDRSINWHLYETEVKESRLTKLWEWMTDNEEDTESLRQWVEQNPEQWDSIIDVELTRNNSCEVADLKAWYKKQEFSFRCTHTLDLPL